MFHPRASSLLFLPRKAGPASARAPLPHGRPRAPSVLPPGPALPLEALLACLLLCLPLRGLLVALTRHHSWPPTADACPLRLGDTSPNPRGREDRLLLRPRGRVKKVFLWDLFPKGRLCSKHAIDFMNPFVPVYTVGDSTLHSGSFLQWGRQARGQTATAAGAAWGSGRPRQVCCRGCEGSGAAGRRGWGGGRVPRPVATLLRGQQQIRK